MLSFARQKAKLEAAFLLLACLTGASCAHWGGRFDCPVPRRDANSKKAHAQLLEKKAQGKIGVYFLGDSITRRWGATDYPGFLEHWKASFHGWHAANFGWGGDQIQNILWRVKNGELDGVDPKVVVLQAGTNDIGSKVPGEGAEKRAQAILKGLEALRTEIRARAPGSVLIQLGIFPRNDNPDAGEIIKKVNLGLAAAAGPEAFRYLEINHELSDEAGKLKPGYTPDGLHLNRDGYEIWAQALKPLLTELLGPPAKVDLAPPATGDPSAKGSNTMNAAAGLPASFQWTSSAPVVSPISDSSYSLISVKDPSVVFFEGRWHLFATTAGNPGGWSMMYSNFSDWSQAASAKQMRLDSNPHLKGYHCAPQVFYFTPQKKWYLIYQSGQPQYSTADDLSKPETWTKPVDFFPAVPETVKTNKGQPEWLDFWVISDDKHCHLFFTNDAGLLYRSQTKIQDFPDGFGEPVVAIKGTKETLFEASATYKIKGSDRYLTLVEAFGKDGRRYYRSFTAPSLDGVWTPLADSWENPFAGMNNVAFENGVKPWTEDISHGELLREGYDEKMMIDPAKLRLLYQGVDPGQRNTEYFQLPYRLGLLTQNK